MVLPIIPNIRVAPRSRSSSRPVFPATPAIHRTASGLEVEVRARCPIPVANRCFLLTCCHSWGDEPESLTSMQLPSFPQELSRKGDESVHRVQASAAPSPGAGQLGTLPPRPASSPAQAMPTISAPAPPGSSSCAGGHPTGSRGDHASPGEHGRHHASQPALAMAISASAASMEPVGCFGELGSFGRGVTAPSSERPPKMTGFVLDRRSPKTRQRERILHLPRSMALLHAGREW